MNKEAMKAIKFIIFTATELEHWYRALLVKEGQVQGPVSASAAEQGLSDA